MFEGAPCLVPVYPVWQSWWPIIMAPLPCFGALCGQCGCGPDHYGLLLWEVLVLDLLNNFWFSSLFLTHLGLPAQM